MTENPNMVLKLVKTKGSMRSWFVVRSIDPAEIFYAIFLPSGKMEPHPDERLPPYVGGTKFFQRKRDVIKALARFPAARIVETVRLKK